MNATIPPDRMELAQKAAEILRLQTQPKLEGFDFEYYSYPQMFGSTAGPFGGLGGDAMTNFQIDAFVWEGFAALFCGGRFWKIDSTWQFGSPK